MSVINPNEIFLLPVPWTNKKAFGRMRRRSRTMGWLQEGMWAGLVQDSGIDNNNSLKSHFGIAPVGPQGLSSHPFPVSTVHPRWFNSNLQNDFAMDHLQMSKHLFICNFLVTWNEFLRWTCVLYPLSKVITDLGNSNEVVPVDTEGR